MPTSHTPTATKPVAPFSLVNDGEVLNFASLWKSATAGIGIIAKILDWCQYVSDRSAEIHGKLTCDGAGAVTITGGSGGVGGGGLYTVAISGTGIRVTLATAKANDDYTVLCTPGNTNSGFPRAVVLSTTQFDLFFKDDAGAAIDCAAVAVHAHFAVLGV